MGLEGDELKAWLDEREARAREERAAERERIENVATGQEWPKDKWATALSLCLSGEALKVFGRLSPEEAHDYEKAKLALLQRFRFTAEGYREKFRHSRPQDEETGTCIVKCMSSPLYDIIVGNVPGSRAADDPDKKWKEKLAEGNFTPNGVAETLYKKKEDHRLKASLSSMKSTSVRPDSVAVSVRSLKMNRRELERAQAEDKTLEACRDKVVVPLKLRSQVLKMAHESLMSGHQGVTRTIDRVLGSFYWPGVQEENKRYVRSCDTCQRMYPKHKVEKAPLGKMPLIDTPFERVAVDIIGPLKPVSNSGNRYILTMVDFATRYPDAIALPAIDSATVTDGLVEMFSRVGFPRQILCDQASCFTSDLMREVNDLLAIKHLSSTPYHPMCNGLVERFNGTLKQMLRKLCQEDPKSWDQLLAPLLFAYREVPQASMGFSPFELIYGRYVRGPLNLLKKLWTGEKIEEEVKTTYGYVLDLRDRLERTLKLAHENLIRAKTTQKYHYDQKSKSRQLKVGDRALILLPTTANKLLIEWKGPFPVIGKKGDYDYWLDLGHDAKLFHNNMLKRYEDWQPDTIPETASFVVMKEEETDTPLPACTVKPTVGVEAIPIGSSLEEDKRTELRKILTTYQDVFSEIPGKTNLLKCRFQLTTSEPINTPQYPLPLAMKEVVEQEVQHMLRLGVIERSHSPYNSPLVLIKKPDNTYRTCVDFRRINEILVSDAEPIPRTDLMFTEKVRESGLTIKPQKCEIAVESIVFFGTWFRRRDYSTCGNYGFEDSQCTST
ncbi:uncharacterized protein LOC142790849 [Rhipicephalus microplus]|uniref:uncharacterized protein LOC142790849 n=1 Tax=Rhipicephalus microplus TaxID=6941 RepID=UPI003F6C82F6